MQIRHVQMMGVEAAREWMYEAVGGLKAVPASVCSLLEQRN